MISSFNRDNPVKNLPDAYCKTNGSNNKKLLDIEKEEMDRQRATIRTIYDSLDLDKATGASLDMFGDMFGQVRGTATDAQYRVLIKAKIFRNMAGSDFNSIVRAICATFDCDPSEVLLVEYEGECSVRVDELPYDKLNNSGIDGTTAMRIISRLIPAGVKFESLNYSGTFRFSGGTELVYDETAGFANEEQTIGGYLGLVFDGDTSELPV